MISWGASGTPAAFPVCAAPFTCCGAAVGVCGANGFGAAPGAPAVLNGSLMSCCSFIEIWLRVQESNLLSEGYEPSMVIRSTPPLQNLSCPAELSVHALAPALQALILCRALGELLHFPYIPIYPPGRTPLRLEVPTRENPVQLRNPLRRTSRLRREYDPSVRVRMLGVKEPHRGAHDSLVDLALARGIRHLYHHRQRVILCVDQIAHPAPTFRWSFLAGDLGAVYRLA